MMFNRMFDWKLGFVASDPELDLIIEYVSRQLSPADAAQVERRMIDDEAFFEKAWPLVQVAAEGSSLALRFADDITRVRHDTGRVPAMSNAELKEAYDDIRDALDLPPRSFEAFKEDCRLNALEREAAGEPPMTITFAGYRHAQGRHHRALAWKYTVIATLALLSLIPLSYTGLAVEGTMRASRSTEEITERRTSTEFLGLIPARTMTGARESRAVDLGDGITVLLGADSRVTHEGHNAALDGHALFVIPPDAGPLLLHASHARLVLTPGRYEIGAPAGLVPVTVRVDAGIAHVYRSNIDSLGVAIREGDDATVTTAAVVKLVKPSHTRRLP